jgi:hypothetical protein
MVHMTDVIKVIPNKISREALQALKDTLGSEWVSEDRAVIETYSRFSVDTAGLLKKHQRDATILPACIALPQSTEDIQAIMRIANRFKVKVIPFTNGMISGKKILNIKDLINGYGF